MTDFTVGLSFGMATNAPQDDWHKTGLRLPKDLHAALHEAAAEGGRSYNGEIVSRLQGSFARKTAVSSGNADVDFLTEIAQERKQAAEHFSTLSMAIAKMLLNVEAKLTPEQKASAPEIEVFKTFAEGVVGGQGPAMQAFLNFLNVGKSTPVAELKARNADEAKRRLKLNRGRDEDTQSSKT